MKHAILLAALSASLFAASGAVSAADKAKGQQIAEQKCAACHATKTGANFDWGKPLAPENPILAGQHRDYLVVVLQGYKAPEKSLTGRKNAVMAGFASQLSAKDMQDVAAFFAAQPGPLAVRR
jgi:cytochrome c553